MQYAFWVDDHALSPMWTTSVATGVNQVNNQFQSGATCSAWNLEYVSHHGHIPNSTAANGIGLNVPVNLIDTSSKSLHNIIERLFKFNT